jgi:4-hydroxy-tetrahydrodipicolinate reductase
MGREVIRAVRDDPELDMVAAVDTRATDEATGCGSDVMGSLDCLDALDIDVLVDFTHAQAAVENILWALDKGINSVVGTTGIPAGKLAEIKAGAEGGAANVLIAPNFALGAVLMMKFAGTAALVFDQCEIIELHHRGKKDSPSGTAITTANIIAKEMDASEAPETVEGQVRGTRGGAIGPVRIHSVRLDGLVAHQEVIFGSKGQTLSIRHDTTDRSCFMPGVILAVKAIGNLPGLTIGLETVLSI